jgi:phosphoserine phosphatase
MEHAGRGKAQIELTGGFRPRPRASHVVFDFDGTLSLIRAGWAEIMLEMFLEMLPRRADESEAELRPRLLEELLSLNGRQTIHQMIQFAGEVKSRGGAAKAPEWYLDEFTARLSGRIRERSAAVTEGRSAAREFVVHGGREVLEAMRRRGYKLYLLSGTLEKFVRQEAELLGLTEFFGPRLFGGHEDHTKFSKQMVFEKILREEKIAGERLVSFGDGPVEILNTKDLGGLAVAVASDETNNGSGRVHPQKRGQLLAAGADAVIADYRGPEELIATLVGE